MEKEKLICQINEKSFSNQGNEDNGMTSNEAILKEILLNISKIDKKVDGVAKKQDLMQIQLDSNTDNINKLNESIAMSKLENTMEIDINTGNGKKRRINDSTETKDSKLTKQVEMKSDKAVKVVDNNTKLNLYNKREKKPRSIMIGSNESSSIKIASRTFDTFVGNLHLESRESDVVDMFSKNNIKIIKYGEIPTRLQRARAYRVRIDYEDKDKIFDSRIWPKGVVMSKFFIKDESDKYSNNNNKIIPRSSSSPKVYTRGDGNI